MLLGRPGRLTTSARPQTPAGMIDYLFAPLKHARLDYMVQKAVEMGAGRLQPVRTSRTQTTRINLDRMRANAIEAAEQCGILTIPTIADEVRFDRLIGALRVANHVAPPVIRQFPFNVLLKDLDWRIRTGRPLV